MNMIQVGILKLIFNFIVQSDPKIKIIKTITSSPHLSIIDYFEKECGWKENTQIPFDTFEEKTASLFNLSNDILR